MSDKKFFKPGVTRIKFEAIDVAPNPVEISEDPTTLTLYGSPVPDWNVDWGNFRGVFFIDAKGQLSERIDQGGDDE